MHTKLHTNGIPSSRPGKNTKQLTKHYPSTLAFTKQTLFSFASWNNLDVFFHKNHELHDYTKKLHASV